MQKVKTKVAKPRKKAIHKTIIVTKTIEPVDETKLPKKLKKINAMLSNTVFME